MRSFKPSSNTHDLILQQIEDGIDDDNYGHQETDPDDVEPELQ